MPKTLHIALMGRFGNQLFQYAHGKALAERHGYQIRCPKWPGQVLFQDCQDPLPDGTEDHRIEGYFQHQSDLIYTKADCQRWFKFKPEVRGALESGPCHDALACHRRVGDYANLGYVVVSRTSYEKACGILAPSLTWVTEENQCKNDLFEGWLGFAQDFYRLATAKILLRGNSSFSWWAHVLSQGQTVYSPVIDGLRGGQEHDCQFVAGNWPKLAELNDGTDLHLRL